MDEAADPKMVKVVSVVQNPAESTKVTVNVPMGRSTVNKLSNAGFVNPHVTEE